jgi:hypothetical protein
MSTLFTASVRLNAFPISCPERVSEVIQGEFVTLAVPVKLTLEMASSSSTVMLGGIERGLVVELKVPV